MEQRQKDALINDGGSEVGQTQPGPTPFTLQPRRADPPPSESAGKSVEEVRSDDEVAPAISPRRAVKYTPEEALEAKREARRKYDRSER
jgi:hypothetical protein